MALRQFDDPVIVWQSAISDLVSVTADLTPEQWLSATPCPGWTVADVVAHISDLDGYFLGDERPEHEPDWTQLPHVGTPAGQFTEIGVDFRRGRTGEELITELKDVTARRGEQLAGADMSETVEWFFGQRTIDQLMRIRTFDIWLHEQDIRDAIGQPGDEDSDAAHMAAARMLEVIPMLFVKGVGATAGQSLQLVLTGPGVSGTWGIEVDDEGRAHFAEVVHPSVSITMTWPLFARRCAGRIAVSKADARVVGDQALGQHFLEALAFTP